MIFKRLMLRHNFFVIASIIFIFLIPLFAGCESRVKKLQTQELSILKIDGSRVEIIAEIASTDEERAQGLMYRAELPAGEAMLFVFDRDQIMSFWMKNTNVPLSIAYISSGGIILEIHDMKPHVEAPVTSSRSARYALEVPQGWFTTVGVQTGDTLSVETL
ncbi:MAG: DUF192 domain-containing protein [Treponema sp.]|jgi:uncharacterized membrane protein (UPF0127 family)|nr:DUF192 domain-containing protein [Treponema sp.]